MISIQQIVVCTTSCLFNKENSLDFILNNDNVVTQIVVLDKNLDKILVIKEHFIAIEDAIEFMVLLKNSTCTSLYSNINLAPTSAANLYYTSLFSS